jgi:hypothetical protein
MAHMHYTGTGKVHSFRGLLADGKQQRIRIQGATGSHAWRITKFNLMLKTFTGNDRVHGVSIWREEQASVSTSAIGVDFDNDELLAAGVVAWDTSQPQLSTQAIVFDNQLFARNIWVTHTEESGGGLINYYIELEEVKVSQAGMAQLSVAAARRIGLNP